MKDKLQGQRFEYKYIVNEHVALAVRDFVSSYLTLDEFGASRLNYSYPVHSLYLDSPDLILYNKTINGDKNRYKLRIRFYEDKGPIYLEIKRRVNNSILKKRAAIHRDAADLLLAGHFPEPSSLIKTDSQQIEALHSFTTLLNKLHAQPQVHVSYLREAWLASASNNVRVTIDRMVRSEPRKQLWLNKEMINPINLFQNKVVLELKFTDRFPNWFKDLVQVFGIRQGSAAKYVDGVYLMGERGMMNSYI